MLFNSDIADFLLKTNEGRNRRPNFVIFVVWSALIVVEWVLVYSRKSYLRPVVFLDLFKDRVCRVGPRIHFLIFDVCQGHDKAG